MNRKKMRKRSISWLLVLSMVMSLFGGEFAAPRSAKAASGEATITFGQAKISSAGYYTYPNLTVTVPDESKTIHNLTVTADSGYIRVMGTTILDAHETSSRKVVGKGILTAESLDEKYGTDGGVSQGSGKEDLSTDSTSMYESITFDFDSVYDVSKEIPRGAEVSVVQAYLRTLRFTTSEQGNQKVTITATTLASTDMKTTVNGKNVQLHYYNGHFYAYVPFAKETYGWETGSWEKAYNEAKTAKFNGVTGYLATLTSRGEDRFLFSTFPEHGNFARTGWIGCTRISLADVESGNIDQTLPKFTGDNPEDFVWRWVSGPEAGEEFGQQVSACGYIDNYKDGGFETKDGYFSNWENGSSNVEPNGGTAMDEGFGYYGKYEYGRWNDWPNDGPNAGYYIEFGGMPGDDEALKDNLGEEVLVSGSEVEDKVVNPNVKDPGTTETPDKKSFSGTPVIATKNSDDEIKAGTILNIDASDVKDDKTSKTVEGYTDYVYKWYVGVEDKTEGTIRWTEIANQTGSSLTLTDELIDHKIKVELVGKDNYEGSIATSKEFDATHTKKSFTGRPSIVQEDEKDELAPGTILVADLEDLVSPADADIADQVDYIWKSKDADGNEKIIGTDPSYVVKKEDQGKDIYLTVKAKDDSNDYTGSATSREPFTIPAAATPTPAPSGAATEEPAPSPILGRPSIENDKIDEESNPLNVKGAVLTANIDKITPVGAKDSLIYQWSFRESDGSLTPIDGANGKSYTLREEDLDKTIVVSVKGNEDEGYYGTRISFPYDTTRQKVAITGKVGVVNKTINEEDGKQYEVKREGTVLEADISGIGPDGAQDSLTYQWGVWNEDGTFEPIEDATDRNYVLTKDEIDKQVGVKVSGSGHYKGTIASDKYDTTRTDSDVTFEESDEEGKTKIVVSPTLEDTVYAIIELGGDEKPLWDIPTVDENDVTQKPTKITEDLSGYYRPAKPGGKLIFTVDKNKQYAIIARKETKTDVVIMSPDIDAEITGYDDKDTLEDNEDDTISVSVIPANPDYKYGILVKKDGKYTALGTKYDETKKEYVYDKSSKDYWTPGGDGKVIFSDLPADGTYKVVALDKNATLEDLKNVSELTPDQIVGGSIDLVSEPHPVQTKKPDAASPSPSASGSPSPSPSTSPSASGSPSASPSVAPSDTPSASPSVSPSGEPDSSASPSVSPSNDPDSSASPSVSPSNDPNASKTPAPSGSPSATPSTSPTATPTGTLPVNTSATLTPDQISKVDKFVEDHGKDSSGEIIKKVDDLTKDIIASGEKEWNEMTAEEQSAVNQRLKDGGCMYTYPQLLEMANAYKIPGFKLHKVMKKGSKAKLKLMKCKGATVIVTSTNRKVATVNKKGVIKAKKKGKATLTITAVKGKYSNRLVVNIEVRKKFKNASELKKFKSSRIKTPTILIAKKRKLKKSTKIKIYGLEKSAKVKYVSYNKKALPINKKGRYTAKKKGKSLMRVTVKQNDKKYFLYLYVTAFK